MMAKLFRRWRLRLAGNRGRHRVPIELELDAILGRQRQEASQMLRDAWYWGLNGSSVAVAVEHAAVAIGTVARSHDLVQYLEDVHAALATAHEEFRQSDPDEDGFGSATFHEIRTAVVTLRLREKQDGRSPGSR